MEMHQLREITDSTASELAEWWAIAHDLDHVIAAISKLLSMFDKAEEDPTLQRALWTSALVAYIRCFKTGRRTTLDPEIYKALEGQPIEAHQYYKDTRDKHIAHPVNSFEETKIGALTDTSGKVIGIGHAHGFRISDDRQGVWQLGNLATVARKHVSETIEHLQTKLLQNLQRRSTDDIASLPALRMQPQGGASAVRSKRKQDT